MAVFAGSKCRYFVAIGLTLTLLPSACGRREAAGGPRVTSCGIPYTAILPSGRHVPLGTCAGLVGSLPPTLSLTKSKVLRIDVLLTDTERSKVPVPSAPAPVSTNPAVLVRSPSTAADLSYRAVHNGKAWLVVPPRMCAENAIKHEEKSCTLVRVDVAN
jgi:hypothetical protein